MIKSFGNYNIERSSSSDINNIKWTQKNPNDKPKNKKKITKNTSPSNIIYTETQKVQPLMEKVFKVKLIINTESKNKKNKANKKFQTSSASNCNIEPGFTRKAR